MSILRFKSVFYYTCGILSAVILFIKISMKYDRESYYKNINVSIYYQQDE